MINENDKITLLNSLKRYAADVLEPSVKNKYCCPFCNSGHKENGTGALSVFTSKKTHYEKWKCFACGKIGDIFNLVEKMEGISTYKEQVLFLQEKYNITIADSVEQARENAVSEPKKEAEEEQDYTSFYEEANRNLDKTTYHLSRGVSLDVLNRFKVGYVEKWIHNDKSYPSSRLIIPTSKSSYVARSTVSDGTGKSIKKGSNHFLGFENMQAAETPIFICEGEYDALSFYEVGAVAVSLGGTNNINQFVNSIKFYKLKQPLILALDNDEPGKKTTVKLAELLSNESIPFYSVERLETLYLGSKDANEALCKDREAFKLAIQDFYAEAQIYFENKIPNEKNEYLQQYATANLLNEFDLFIQNASNTCIATGFPLLDDYLDGGLYEGLYCLGAISSLGKTTFLLQIADQIAQQGHDVLFISLEMSKYEIIAKSLSRLTFEIAAQNYRSENEAKTTRGLLAGALYPHYSTQELELIQQAKQEYKAFANHLFIIEGQNNVTAQTIRDAVTKHYQITGNKPVVMIDYLQIISPSVPNLSDKQNTDKAVTELKQVSRDYHVPVIAISSFNRENYRNEVDLTSFKESGAIEYSSDVLLGLQFTCIGDRKDFDVHEAAQADVRAVDLKILKNRNGRTGSVFPFSFMAKFNYYQEGQNNANS